MQPPKTGERHKHKRFWHINSDLRSNFECFCLCSLVHYDFLQSTCHCIVHHKVRKARVHGLANTEPLPTKLGGGTDGKDPAPDFLTKDWLSPVELFISKISWILSVCAMYPTFSSLHIIYKQNLQINENRLESDELMSIDRREVDSFVACSSRGGGGVYSYNMLLKLF